MIGAIVGDIAGSGSGCFTANSVMFLAVGQALMECDHKYVDLTEMVRENSDILMRAIYQDRASEMQFNLITCIMPVAYYARNYREVAKLTSQVMGAFPESTLEDNYVAELEVAMVFRYVRFLSVRSFRKAFSPKRLSLCKETGEYLGEIDKAFRASKSFAEAILLAKETPDPGNMASVVGAMAEPYHGVPVSFRNRALEVLGPELADLFVRIETFAEPRVSTYVPDDTRQGVDHYDAERFYPNRRDYLRKMGDPKTYFAYDPISIGSASIDLSALKREEKDE